MKTALSDKRDVGYEALNPYPYTRRFRQLRRRNNDRYAACYALYRLGKSLAYIAEVHYRGRFTRQALYEVFKTRGYPLRSRKLRPARTYAGRIYRQDSVGLYRSRTGGITTYMHRLIWEELHGPLPLDHVIIFKDGDRENLVPENLQCLHREEAKKLYNHANQFGWKRARDKGPFRV